MHFVERHEKIIQTLEKEKIVKVTELSISLNVTEKTVRQDLIVLENKGLLKRIYGGAILPESTGMLPVEKRQASFLHEKKQAAKAAAERIEEEDTVFLDGGSTMLELAKLLIHRKITVITNDIKIAHTLLGAEKVQLIMPGGGRIPASSGLYGPIAQEALQKMKVKKLFLGTTAADFVNGLTVFSHFQAEYKKTIISMADHVTLVTDHTKFGQTALIQYAGFQDIDEVVTNADLTERWKKELEKRGISVTYAVG
ncbi:DeoR/GlpR transcriptional regulator [Metabacillus sp. KIGAM252]|uniref:DeoR/GlpR transcriptional regulator n=1 Tax=Metabacillus flavus TaxID=2823519 RepID=A0ABS5LE89_9BACI|nr:DeoR/GlpR family DNA-binding transcription regulator [Metabacillus flavus]MBS2968719.1 DeoR/GlpR transcriptional regulator [Metabacillus flavus]